MNLIFFIYYEFVNFWLYEAKTKLPDDPDLKDVFGHPKLNDKVKYFFGKTENYRSVKVFSSWSDDAKVLYVWSILFSQLVASILVGIVLQLLWEDRPITEPL